jgi:uncharacterized protein (DUF58 family)
MIVPRSRLLLWVGAIVVPFAALGGVVPETALGCGMVIAALFLVVALDAFLALRCLDGIGAELPPIVRFSKDRAGVVEIKIKNARQTARRVRIGLALPPEIVSRNEDVLAVLPAGSEWSRLAWPCAPLRRGNYLLNKCYLEGESPLGFWSVRGRTPVQSEVRVYPNLLTERKSVAALFLNRGSFGVHTQRQVGQGREFEKLRDYVPGDSFDEIHWRATAKRGHPVTKTFQIERTQEIYVIIDASRLSARIQSSESGVPDFGLASRADPAAKTSNAQRARRGAQPGGSVTTTLERFVTAALVLGLAAERQGDLFGLLTFSNRVHKFVRARNGKAHYGMCRDALYTLQPQTVTPDFDEVCTFIRLRLRRRALLLFLTTLDDPVVAESFVHDLNLICHQHLILVNMLKPWGVEPLFSDPNVKSLDELYQRLGGHVRWQQLNELEKILQRRGARFSLLDNERLSAQLVSQYLGVKQRQML